jgi:hypothetical protein
MAEKDSGFGIGGIVIVGLAVLSFIPLPIFSMTTSAGTVGAYPVQDVTPVQENWNSITNSAAPTTPARVVTIYKVNRNFWQMLMNPFPGGM